MEADEMNRYGSHWFKYFYRIMYLVHNKFPREQFTGFFASLRMTLLGFIESDSDSDSDYHITIAVIPHEAQRNEGSW